MIIDATHAEETRVALVDHNNRLTDFDFESATKLTVRGNVYLAKIARVEPSLQAAFIDYGGNRHGFLAFSEIHPDYFRIPVSDREALKAEMHQVPAHQEEDDPVLEDQNSTIDLDTTLDLDDVALTDISKDTDHHIDMQGKTSALQDSASFHDAVENFETHSGSQDIDLTNADMPIAILGGETSLHDDEDFTPSNRPHLHQMYKIQEVIHKNQILLVQVAKEERGMKGAALTTYLSLAGRYSVLMPNSPRSGGISRKISNSIDRLRLKKVLEELEIPDGMGLIIRTAGRERTKVEIKRDAEFLMRAWNGIRDLTLQSIAPQLIHEEDDIIKRAIRDLYTKDVEEIQVEGEEGYKVARQFMKNLMPSHFKRIQHYKDESTPLFYKYKVEAQIDEMHNPVVYLPSGGSIVIHPTEALVSIDINSGRSTRERHIEETAFKTNLEAADEIARQIRLRDLAGLVVIDFIDMEENRYIATVEKRLRDAFRHDRARIQMGKIGPFGLLELSRQRIRPSILETSAHPCPHCQATGYVRSTESSALHMLRAIEEEASLGKMSEFQIHVPTSVAFYLLNTKRDHLQRLEARLDVRVFVEGDDSLISPQHRITCLKRRSSETTDTKLSERTSSFTSRGTSVFKPVDPSDTLDDLPEEEIVPISEEKKQEEGSSQRRNRHRRSRRRSHKNRDMTEGTTNDQTPSDESQEDSFDQETLATQDQIVSDQNASDQEMLAQEGNQNSDRDPNDTRSRHPFKRRRRRHPNHNQNRFSNATEGQENHQNDQNFSTQSQNVEIKPSEIHYQAEIPIKNIEKSNFDQLSYSKSESPQIFEPSNPQFSEQQGDQNSQDQQKKKRGNTWWKRLIDN